METKEQIEEIFERSKHVMRTPDNVGAMGVFLKEGRMMFIANDRSKYTILTSDQYKKYQELLWQYAGNQYKDKEMPLTEAEVFLSDEVAHGRITF